MSTSAGWDGVLDAIINEENCDPPDNDKGYPGNCGSATVGITFLLSYLVISFLIVINMYIAVILENYSQATEDVQEGLTDDDYDMYYEIWQQFDPEGTQYIRYDQLSEFLDVLEPPLQIHKPNKYKIISMDIPICRGDLMYCVDILDALTKDFFARKGNPIEETGEIGEIAPRPETSGYIPVSSTLWRQREEYCARLIQRYWRNFKNIPHPVAGEQTTTTNNDEPPSNNDNNNDNNGANNNNNDNHNNNDNNNDNGGAGDNNGDCNGRNGEGDGDGIGDSNNVGDYNCGDGDVIDNGQALNELDNIVNNNNLNINDNNNLNNNDHIGVKGTISVAAAVAAVTTSATTTIQATTALSPINSNNTNNNNNNNNNNNTNNGRQTAVLVESDGFITKNGHKVVIHSRSPSITSRTAADV